MRTPRERLQMEFRHEPCLEYRLQAESPLANTRLKAELRTNNKTGRNSHSCRPRLILGNINAAASARRQTFSAAWSRLFRAGASMNTSGLSKQASFSST